MRQSTRDWVASRTGKARGAGAPAGGRRAGGRWKSHRPLPYVEGSHFPAKEIIPRLWIGSEVDARDRDFLAAHDIRLVVNATNNIPVSLPRGVASYRVPLDDHPSENEAMLRHLPIAVEAIDDVLRHGQGVLVHCRAGMQRSAAVVAAYLMWKRGLTADQAFEFINRIKHETFYPVPTFEQALRAWGQRLEGR